MQTQSAYSYRNLDTWQDSQGLAAEVIAMIKTMPMDVMSREISRQLVRSVGSAPANIAEGHGRFSKGAFRNHLLIARGSLCEVSSWMDVLRRTDYSPAETGSRLVSSTDSLISRITAKARALAK
ncbi:MAG TPA: four helix bundle protein [Dehalococcoidia bacterium]|nr:four helix bundle protein [Dehalococcoidia bacterium]